MSRSEHLEKTGKFFQVRCSAIHVHRPYAFPSMLDFDFVGLGCGILTFSGSVFFRLKTVFKNGVLELNIA